MFKKIMVAVDGSSTSELALETALNMVKELHSELSIVYVVDEFVPVSPDIAFDFDKYEKFMRGEGKQILQKMAAKALVANVPAQTYLVEATEQATMVADKIIAFSKEHHMDLIVIGTHGRRGLKRVLLGSVAENVARLAEVPVLLIRENAKSESKK